MHAASSNAVIISRRRQPSTVVGAPGVFNDSEPSFSQRKRRHGFDNDEVLFKCSLFAEHSQLFPPWSFEGSSQSRKTHAPAAAGQIAVAESQPQEQASIKIGNVAWN